MEAGPGLYYATHGNLIFAIEATEPSVAYIDALKNFVPQMTRDLGCGVGLMVVIRSDAKPPSEQVREHIKIAGRSFAPHVLAFAHVVEGEGFLAAAKRAAFTLVMSSARLGFPVKVFRNVAEGMPWLIHGVGNTFQQDIKRDELVRLVDDFRRRQFEKPSKRAP
jgi:hypothetical protein